MNLNYSDEQNMLREQVLKFCETNYDFADREKILDSEAGYSPENWKEFAELGWLAVPFSEDNGGYNFGPIELTVLFEEFGKSLVVEPYLSSVVMSGTILENSNYSAKQALLESIISGDHQISVAYAEANIGYNFLDCVTSLDAKGDNLVLNGSKTIVLNAANSNQFIVLAIHDGKPALVLVDSDTSGLELQSFRTLDGQTCGELTFENVAL
ncbi:MAG: acyl-CoA/acyl-ACP dehydrogenase, partial [Gammaproteobacteria bacterium]|nr:acyl-CoA/acyl-ACP dehydrogenase [Gammaproteobacteria bacterium]